MADEPVPAAPPVETPPAAAPPVEAPAPAVAEAPAAPERAPSLLHVDPPAEKPADPPPVADPPPAEVKSEAPPAEAKAAEPPPAEKPPAEKPADPPAEVKPPEAEAVPPEEVKDPPAEPPQPEPPPALEYKYELPEVIKMDDAQRTELHGVLDAYRADPSNLQPLIDYHVARMNDFAESERVNQHTAWAKTVDGWRTEVMGDEVLGGAGHQTAMMHVAQVRDRFISDHKPGTPEYKQDVLDYNHMLDSTGVGNHRVMLRMLHRMHRFLGEPKAPQAPDKPPPQPRGNLLHDNPRSRVNGRT